jgi:hypothetical protein
MTLARCTGVNTCRRTFALRFAWRVPIRVLALRADPRFLILITRKPLVAATLAAIA